MNIHEFQAKELLRALGVPVPPGAVADSALSARHAAEHLGGPVWVVKAQIHAGDRGKAGGIRIANGPAEVERIAGDLLGRRLVTPQTGPAGMLVERVYVERAVKVARELYAALLVDRARGVPTFVAAARGGMQIEELARISPEQLRQHPVDLEPGISAEDIRAIGGALELTDGLGERVAAVLSGMWNAFVSLDASLIEINPLAVTEEGELLALDVKMSFDDNALRRHPQIEALRDETDEQQDKLERVRHGFNYVRLDGNIGCVVTGAGLALATMDILRSHDGEPANFLDLPPAATRVQVAEAVKLILADHNVRAILVNAIGGGMTRCDVVAEGITTAAREVSVSVPLIVRFAGTSIEMGEMLLRNSRLETIFAKDLDDAARKAVRAARGAR